MSETYTVGGDTYQRLESGQRFGQSFAPWETHILKYIDLELKMWAHYPPISIWVYHADHDHFPWGDAITDNVSMKYPFFLPGQTKRIRFPLRPVTLEQYEQYVFTVNQNPTPFDIPNEWLYDKDDAAYVRGMRIFDLDDGNGWQQDPGSDNMFAEFGDPPAPLLLPTPPISNFAPMTLQRGQLYNGVCLRLGTNVPCHLTCYYSDFEPQRHPLTKIVRGLNVPWYTRFCFVAWRLKGQIEPGDTLYHTFPLDNWRVNRRRWFTFRGNIDEELSPSVGPIFEHKLTGETAIDNPSFEQIIPLTPTSTPWSLIHVGVNWTDYEYDSEDKIHGTYSLKRRDIGYGAGSQLKQWIDMTPYRGQSVEFVAYAKERSQSHNYLEVWVDGTGGWSRRDWPTDPLRWQRLSVSGWIPQDATTAGIVASHNNGSKFGPQWCWWDRFLMIL